VAELEQIWERCAMHVGAYNFIVGVHI